MKAGHRVRVDFPDDPWYGQEGTLDEIYKGMGLVTTDRGTEWRNLDDLVEVDTAR